MDALVHVSQSRYKCTLKQVHCQVADMPANSARIANPFIYGRVLGSQDAACPRSTYELAIEEAIANRGRLALVGDRRLGKSTLVERTHQVLSAPLLHWDFHYLRDIPQPNAGPSHFSSMSCRTWPTNSSRARAKQSLGCCARICSACALPFFSLAVRARVSAHSFYQRLIALLRVRAAPRGRANPSG